jgi:ATP-dependent protease ClpP protease subunit
MPHGIASDRPNLAAARRVLVDMKVLMQLREAAVRMEGELTYAAERPIRAGIERAAREGRIVLAINSPGGIVQVADRIERDLRGSGVPIFARVGRQCSSAAIGPLFAAQRRVGRWDSRFHLHNARLDPNDVAWRDIDSVALRELAARLDQDDRGFRTALVLNTNLSEMLLQRACSRAGLTLHGYEAVAFRLIDRIE